MPSSLFHGKNVTVKMVEHINPERILDIGAGEGTYSTLLKPVIPDAEFVGIDIWGPYLESFNLNDKYDTVVISDVRYLDYKSLGEFDLAIAGDILEHMTKDDAISVIAKIMSVSKKLIVSIPVFHAPQGTRLGNPYEAHVKEDWSTKEFVETFENDYNITILHDDILGVYLLAPKY